MQCVYTVWFCSVDDQEHVQKTVIETRLTVVYLIRVINEVQGIITWRSKHLANSLHRFFSLFPEEVVLARYRKENKEHTTCISAFSWTLFQRVSKFEQE